MTYTFSDRIQRVKPSAIREILKVLAQDPDIIPFSTGSPSNEAIPVEDIRRIADRIFRENGAASLQYSMTEGYPALRESTRARLKQRFGVGRDFDQVIVTTGGQQGLSLAANVLCGPGDTVIVESPTFVSGINAMRIHGANVVGVGMDGEGIDLEKLEHALKTQPSVRLLYLIPTFQNPSGKTMSLARRRAVYELCVRHNVVILEDDPYSELRFRGEDIPPIKSMDEEGIVIYNGSYSKILSAGMRVGFLCAADELMQRLIIAKQFSDCHTNIFFQMVTDEWLKTCDVNGHIEKIRGIYRGKCDLMLKTMDGCFDRRVAYTRPDGGLFLWCTLPDGCDSMALSQIALDKGVAFVPGRDFMADSGAVCASFRLNFSTPSPENIQRGVALLDQAIREYLK